MQGRLRGLLSELPGMLQVGLYAWSKARTLRHLSPELLCGQHQASLEGSRDKLHPCLCLSGVLVILGEIKLEVHVHLQFNLQREYWLSGPLILANARRFHVSGLR